MNKRYFFIVFAVAVLLVSAVLLLVINKVNSPTPISKVNAHFETTSQTWQIGKTYLVNLVIENKDIPTAATIHVIVDPQFLRIEDAKEGDVWTSANILQKKIDASLGDLIFSEGQGFDAKLTDKATLATLSVTALKQTKSTNINLALDSATAKVKSTVLNQLLSLPFSVSVSK